MASVSRPEKAPSACPTALCLARAGEVFDAELDAIAQARGALDAQFAAAVELLASCAGRIVVTGMGKSGLIGQKLSATLASVGVASFYLHAAEAWHGDLGRVVAGDVVVLLSNSGQSQEIVRLLRPLARLGARRLAITAEPQSALARSSDLVLCIGRSPEACPLGLAPTASTAAMLVLGDALAMCVLQRRGVQVETYARLHPGGALGRQLMSVADVMRRGQANPVAPQKASLREVVRIMGSTPGRPGAASIVDGRGVLVGFFTDGDLRRLLEQPGFCIDRPIAEIVQGGCKSVAPHMLVAEATQLLRQHRIDQLPVLGPQGAPVGLLDIQDVLVVSP